MVEIPDSAKNTQSTVIHALSLVCCLLMISSLARNGPATTVSLRAVKGELAACLQETMITLRPIRVNSEKQTLSMIDRTLVCLWIKRRCRADGWCRPRGQSPAYMPQFGYSLRGFPRSGPRPREHSS